MRTVLACLLTLLIAEPASAQDRTKALLRELSEAAGPSGFEEPVRAAVTREMKPLADRLTYDGLGSVIAHQGASGPRVMLDAHMDELGGLVRRVTPTGFLSMQMLGGWLDQALPDQRWMIIGSKGPVRAVTGIRDIHVVPPEERTKVFARDSLYLDVGAHDAAEVAALGLSPGDPVVPDSPFEELAGGRYLGKAWDDRVGCAVVIEAMRRLRASGHPNQVDFVITTQEEVGLRGAESAAEVVKPEVAIAIEGGITGDDAAKLLYEVTSRFPVALEGFEFGRFFPSETEAFDAQIEDLIGLGGQRQPLTVQHLASVLERGAWFDPTPEF